MSAMSELHATTTITVASAAIEGEVDLGAALRAVHDLSRRLRAVDDSPYYEVGCLKVLLAEMIARQPPALRSRSMELLRRAACDVFVGRELTK